MEALLAVIPILLFVSLFGGMIAFAVRRASGAAERLTALAHRLGLVVHARPKVLGFIRQMPEADGHRRGKRVRLFTFTTGSGKSTTHWAAVTAAPAEPTGLTFRISPEGVGTKLRALFGAKEIKVGDPAFDARWFVQTNAADFLRAALLPELRARLDRIAKMGGTGTYETIDGAIRYAEIGWFNDAARCERFTEVVETVCDLADVAEVYGGRSASR